MNTTTMSRPQPVMLRPTSRQYPFDEVCTKIVQALEERNWKIPGMNVKFRTYGSGEALFRVLEEISGKNFTLHYSRSQALNHGWYDVAAIHRIAIPMKDLEVWEDESGPTLHVYAGKDWTRHRARFLDGIYKYDRRMKKLYASFTSGCDCGATRYSVHHTHTGQRSPILIPKGPQDWGLDRTNTYRTDDLFAEITAWLEEHVLKLIVAHPLVQPNYGRFDETDVPMPANLPPIYCFAEYSDGDRIRQGQQDINQVQIRNRYALQPGWRWVSLDSMRDDSIPMAAFEGAVWCGFGAVDATSTIEKMEISGHHSWNETFVCRVTPNRANDVYVADHAPYLEVRKHLEARLNGRTFFTNEEILQMDAAKARTIVPITEYDGSFTLPVVLIQRELGFDEVEVVTEPIDKGLKQYWREAQG